MPARSAYCPSWARADLADSYADGVVFVDLAPLQSPQQVVPTIAHLLGVRELVGMTLQERLQAYLQSKHMLLLIDNFEHVLEAAALVAELLRAAPRLVILVTSQVILRLSGEYEYPVPPLEVPPADDRRMPSHTGQASPSGYSAVQLFVARAQAMQPTFKLTEVNAPTVAEICRRLDGLPLAIELAAARVKIFTPEALLARLGERLRLLTSGARDLPARQQALRTTIDWSYQLLTPAEQQLLRRVAVFVGGWTMEAAEAICDIDGDLGIAVLDGLQGLVNHSLIRQEAGPDGTPRFRQLETIREYARELFAASPDVQIVANRHAEYFCALAEEAETHNFQPTEALWNRRLIADFDNIQVALTWATGASGTSDIALRLAAALLLFWINLRPLHEAFRWLETALASSRGSTNSSLYAKVIGTAANIALFSGDFRRAELLLTEMLACYEALGDHRGCSEALNLLGILKHLTGYLMQALALEEASLHRARLAGNKERAAWALVAIGRTYYFRGEYAMAIRKYEECLLSEALQSRSSHHYVCAVLADALYWNSEDIRAATLLEESLPHLRAESSLIMYFGAIKLQAWIAHQQGADHIAEALLRESLVMAYRDNLSYVLPQIYYAFGILQLSSNDYTNAHESFRKGLILFRGLENPLLTGVALLGTGITALLQDDRATAAQHYGESITLLQTWRENMLAREAALVVAISGLLLTHEIEVMSAAAQAARIWGAIAAIEPRTAGKRVTPPFLSLPRLDTALLQHAQATARTTLGDTAFDAAFAAGHELTLEEAVAAALALTSSAAVQPPV